MLDYIEKLKARPEQNRRQIALVVTTVLFSGIAALWFLSSSLLGEANGNEEPANAESSLETPFDTLKGIFSGVGDTVNEVRETGFPEVF